MLATQVAVNAMEQLQRTAPNALDHSTMTELVLASLFAQTVISREVTIFASLAFLPVVPAPLRPATASRARIRITSSLLRPTVLKLALPLAVMATTEPPTNTASFATQLALPAMDQMLRIV